MVNSQQFAEWAVVTGWSSTDSIVRQGGKVIPRYKFTFDYDNDVFKAVANWGDPSNNINTTITDLIKGLRGWSAHAQLQAERPTSQTKFSEATKQKHRNWSRESSKQASQFESRLNEARLNKISTDMISQSIGAFEIKDNRLIGEILYIATNKFNPAFYGKAISSFVQGKTVNNEILFLKENRLTFLENQRDERIIINESAFDQEKIILKFFVWKSLDEPLAFTEIAQTEVTKIDIVPEIPQVELPEILPKAFAEPIELRPKAELPEILPRFEPEKKIDTTVNPSMISQSIGAFQYVDNRIKGEILYIVENTFNPFYYGKVIKSIVQGKNDLGQVIFVKENNLRFTDKERDERIIINESAEDSKFVSLEFMVWLSLENPLAFADKKFIKQLRPQTQTTEIKTELPKDKLFDVLKAAFILPLAISLLTSGGKN